MHVGKAMWFFILFSVESCRIGAVLITIKIYEAHGRWHCHVLHDWHITWLFKGHCCYICLMGHRYYYMMHWLAGLPWHKPGMDASQLICIMMTFWMNLLVKNWQPILNNLFVGFCPLLLHQNCQYLSNNDFWMLQLLICIYPHGNFFGKEWFPVISSIWVDSHVVIGLTNIFSWNRGLAIQSDCWMFVLD